MRESFDVVFLLEHKDREFATVRSIAQCLTDTYGARCLVASMYFHVHYLNRIETSTVVLPYAIMLDDYPLDQVERRFKNGISYCNLNWEQLLSRSNQAYKRPRDSFVRERVVHVAWQETFKRFLIDSGVQPENIAVCGNPAVDLLFVDDREKTTLKSEFAHRYKLRVDRPWLFLPMNYGWAFSPDHHVESKIRKGYDEKTAWAYRDFARRSLSRFLPFVHEICSSGRYETILRPHPSISEEHYREAFRTQCGQVPESLLITKDHTVREWLAVSDLVGSSWSTVAWDAYNMGIRSFLFIPEALPDFLHVWWNDELPHVKSVRDIETVAAANPSRSAGTSVAQVAEFIWRTKGNMTKAVSHWDRRTLTVTIKEIIMQYLPVLARYSVDAGQQYDYFAPIHVIPGQRAQPIHDSN